MRIEADWVTAGHSTVIMNALDGQGYFVGGCVRNALLQVSVADIDIATPLQPLVVLERLNTANIKAIPTGLKHGTITAVHQGTPVEITTFRTDVDTDGRHATVRYTTNISEDAARRDFSMNALYADRDGNVIDPLNGLPDLQAGLVRFIGSPEDRIREDYLRILRFFRFHALYGADGLDADGLAACAALAEGVDTLARERVGWEFRKLLGANDPAPSVAAMAASGILARCLPGADARVLPVLVHLEQQSDATPDWMRRLAVLGGEDVANALRFSRSEGRDLHTILTAIEASEPTPVAAYRHGQDVARSIALILAASSGAPLSPDLETELRRGAQASFPVTAKDLLARRVLPGPELGLCLEKLEARWIASGFTLDKRALLSDLPD